MSDFWLNAMKNHEILAEARSFVFEISISVSELLILLLCAVFRPIST